MKVYWMLGAWHETGCIRMVRAEGRAAAASALGVDMITAVECTTPALLRAAGAHPVGEPWEETVTKLPSVYDQFWIGRGWDYEDMEDAGYDII